MIDNGRESKVATKRIFQITSQDNPNIEITTNTTISRMIEISRISLDLFTINLKTPFNKSNFYTSIKNDQGEELIHCNIFITVQSFTESIMQQQKVPLAIFGVPFILHKNVEIAVRG